jgi:hypothetical protein
MRNVTGKIVEKIKTHFLCLMMPLPPFSSQNHAIKEIMWSNMVEPDRPQMCFVCWITG